MDTDRWTQTDRQTDRHALTHTHTHSHTHTKAHKQTNERMNEQIHTHAVQEPRHCIRHSKAAEPKPNKVFCVCCSRAQAHSGMSTSTHSHPLLCLACLYPAPTASPTLFCLALPGMGSLESRIHFSNTSNIKHSSEGTQGPLVCVEGAGKVDCTR